MGAYRYFYVMTHPEPTETPDSAPPETHVGPFLRHVRTTLGLNLRDAAKSAHVSFTYLAEVERGERTPTDAWLRSYTEHLGAVIAQRHRNVA